MADDAQRDDEQPVLPEDAVEDLEPTDGEDVSASAVDSYMNFNPSSIKGE